MGFVFSLPSVLPPFTFSAQGSVCLIDSVIRVSTGTVIFDNEAVFTGLLSLLGLLGIRIRCSSSPPFWDFIVFYTRIDDCLIGSIIWGFNRLKKISSGVSSVTVIYEKKISFLSFLLLGFRICCLHNPLL